MEQRAGMIRSLHGAAGWGSDYTVCKRLNGRGAVLLCAFERGTR